jgi:NDP-sugar pyrophosphorylase family protein
LRGFVLAAGEGTRMQPLSGERPKPLLPILDVPQLGWSLARLAEANVEASWVNAAGDGEAVLDTARRWGRRLGIEIMGSHETPGPRGTAGALKKVAADLNDTIVVVNADIASDVPISLLIEAHRSARSEATLLSIPSEDAADLVVEEGWVTDLIDRREELRWGHRYGGIAVLEPGVLAHIPQGDSGLFETVMKGLVSEGSQPAAVVWDGYWAGVDTPRRYLEVNLDVLAGTFPPPSGLPSEGEVVGDLVHLAEGAELSGGDARHSVVGARAKIGPGVLMDRSVVWEGVVVAPGEYRDCVITPHQIVQT